MFLISALHLHYKFWKKKKSFNKEYHVFKKTEKRFSLEINPNLIILNESTKNTEFDGHYIYHPAWATRIIKQINPSEHVDISSTLHFSSILSAFINIKYYDYRPALLNLSGLTSNFADLNKLPFATNSIKSLSCMHTIEHVGLGRYGDTLDNDGDLKAIEELKRVVCENGNLLIVVPIGKPKIVFNAHRIYSHNQILSYFNGFELKDFSLITDKNEFILNATETQSDSQNYGCGCFWFVKR